MKEAKKMKRYKRLVHKELLQISGLCTCSTPFLSYLPKCFMQLTGADVHQLIWRPEMNKNIWDSILQ